ncbi:hypothetical protein PsAD46_01656 [Pseudovibrio sp. Ad46]|nr:hypothetical protein PsAD46_01656 [Pseudovibrio sp. Ad46]
MDALRKLPRVCHRQSYSVETWRRKINFSPAPLQRPHGYNFPLQPCRAFLTYLLVSALVVAALLGELLFEHAACFSSTHGLAEVETLHVFATKLEQLQCI